MPKERDREPTAEGGVIPTGADGTVQEARKWLRLAAAMHKQWFTQDEAAFYCGVSSSQFRKYRREFQFPVYEGMGKLLFARRDLDALIEATESVPTTGAGGEGISAMLANRPQFDVDLSRYPERLARRLAKLKPTKD